MHRFWKRYIKPVIDLTQPRRVLEIGSEYGWNTRPLLEYCRETGAHADIVDPAPTPTLLGTLAEFEGVGAFHKAKSFAVIPNLAPHDLVLLDGDHNWHTVHTELGMIYGQSQKAGVAPPIILSHDCAWPYARRDMYYDPAALDERERHPYAYRGIVPGHPYLVDDGLNSTFANALVEGGARNGVLTALEDFVAASPHDIDFRFLPFHNGLGVLIPKARMTPELKALIDGFFSSESLITALEGLEEDGMRVRVELWNTRERLTQRTEALKRARELLEKQQARIAELEAKAKSPA